MNYFAEISRIIDYGLECNKNKLRSQVRVLIEKLEKRGEIDKANDLEAKLENRNIKTIFPVRKSVEES